MGLGRDVGRRRPGGLGRAEGQRVQVAGARLRDGRERRCRSPGTSEAASLISARTGVMPRVPMICALVISAPSQCERSISSRPETPGKRYLLPPENPTTSCGKTGPDDQRDVVLDHVAVDADVRGVLEHAVRELGDPLGADRADVRERRRLPPGVVEHGRRRDTGRRGAPASASSLIAPCVPSATSTVSLRDAAVQRGVDRAQQQRQRACCGCRPERARRRCARRGPRRRAGRARTRGSRRSARTPWAPPILPPRSGSTVVAHGRRCDYTAVAVTDSVLALHPDRLLPVDPETRAIARRLYAAVRELPIVSPARPRRSAPAARRRAVPGPRDAVRHARSLRDAAAARVRRAARGARRRRGAALRGRARARSGGSCASTGSVFRGTPMRLLAGGGSSAEIFGVDAAAVRGHGGRDLRPARRAPRRRTPTARARSTSASGSPCWPPPTTRATTSRPTTALAADPSWTGRVIPTFRPDRYLEPAQPGWAEAVAQLGEAADADTGELRRVTCARSSCAGSYFVAHGAVSADHSHEDVRTDPLEPADAARIYRARAGRRRRPWTRPPRSAATCCWRWRGCRARTGS